LERTRGGEKGGGTSAMAWDVKGPAKLIPDVEEGSTTGRIRDTMTT